MVWNEYAKRTARPRAPETLFGLRDEVLETAEKLLEAIPFLDVIAKVPSSSWARAGLAVSTKWKFTSS
jgi:hypothetical protein